VGKYNIGDEVKIVDGSNDKGIILAVDFTHPRIGNFYKVERTYESGRKLIHWYDEDHIVV